MYAVGTFHFGTFDLPIEIRPARTSCPVVSCFGKPGELCMYERNSDNMMHVCYGSNYEAIFCPSTSIDLYSHADGFGFKGFLADREWVGCELYKKKLLYKFYL